MKHCLRYDESAERHAITEKLARLQNEVRVVKRASWMMGLLIVLAGASLACPGNLVQYLPNKQFIMNMVLGLFAGSSFCFLTFIVFGVFLYTKLHRQREACRQLLMRLFAARLAPVRA